MTNSNKDQEAEEIYVGNYYDILGHEGEIRFTLRQSDEHGNSFYNGTCELILKDADAPVIFKGTAQNLLSDPADKRSTSGTVNMTFVSDPESAKESDAASGNEESWTAALSMQIQPAEPFAKKAICGTLEAPEDGTGLGGGVWIAWQFAGVSKEQK